MIKKLSVTFILHLFVLVIHAQVPVLSSFSPSSGIPGDKITVSGINLESISGVKFGNAFALLDSMINISAGEFSIIIPVTTASGNVFVTVTTPGGVSSAVAYTIPPRLPQISSAHPSSGEVDDIITVEGVYLLSVTSVKIGTANIDVSLITYLGSNMLAMPVAPVKNSGVFDLIISNVYGASKEYGTNNTYKYTVTGINVPKLKEVLPQSGKKNDEVTIIGFDFTTIIGIGFGNTLADLSTLKILNDTTLAVKVPLVGLGANNIVVYSVRGESQSKPFVITAPPPTITGLYPTATRIGSTVTVFGSNFITLQSVFIENVSTPGYNLLNANTLAILIPNNVASKAKIKIKTAYGEAVSAETITIDTVLSILIKYPEIENILFPNPAVQLLNINFHTDITRILIYDIFGNMVHYHTMGDLPTINITHWKRGIYYGLIYRNQNASVQKIILE
ncbi:MAG: T9SS type A sorting domain-containing protein [Cytophagales bacterium]|nr:T9SS type A sorting domain-containing protein [Cytophagales bacterium]